MRQQERSGARLGSFRSWIVATIRYRFFGVLVLGSLAMQVGCQSAAKQGFRSLATVPWAAGDRLAAESTAVATVPDLAQPASLATVQPAPWAVVQPAPTERPRSDRVQLATAIDVSADETMPGRNRVAQAGFSAGEAGGQDEPKPIPAENAIELLDPPSSVPEAQPRAGEWEMTIEDLLRYAVDHHPTLSVRYHEIEMAQARLITANTRPNPEFVLDVEAPIHESDSTDMSTRVTLPLFTGRKRQMRSAVACEGIRRARWALDQETDLILQEVVDAATEVLYLQELVQLKAEISRLSDEMASAAIPIASPSFTEVKLLIQVSAEVDSASAEAERYETNTQLAIARRNLARAIGLAPPALPSVLGEMDADLEPLMSLESVLAVAREYQPGIAGAEAAVSESWREHGLAHAESRPDPEFGPRYDDPLGEDRDRIGIRFQMDLPLFDRNQGAICETAAQVRANQAALRVVELNTLSDVAAAYAELVTIQESLQFFTTRVAKLEADTRSQLENEAVQRGISAYQEKRIQLELARLAVERLDLLYRYHRLLAHLEVYLGQPITLSQS